MKSTHSSVLAGIFKRYAAWKWKRHCRRELRKTCNHVEMIRAVTDSLLISQLSTARDPALIKARKLLESSQSDRPVGLRLMGGILKLLGAMEKTLCRMMGEVRYNRFKWTLLANGLCLFLRICSLKWSARR